MPPFEFRGKGSQGHCKRNATTAASLFDEDIAPLMPSLDSHGIPKSIFIRPKQRNILNLQLLIPTQRDERRRPVYRRQGVGDGASGRSSLPRFCFYVGALFQNELFAFSKSNDDKRAFPACCRSVQMYQKRQALLSRGWQRSDWKYV
jgi:hypothetical protein